MRPINPDTGKPYPKKHGVNWGFVSRALAWRREAREKASRGMTIRKHMFNEQLISDSRKRIVAAEPSACGRYLYLDIVEE